MNQKKTIFFQKLFKYSFIISALLIFSPNIFSTDTSSVIIEHADEKTELGESWNLAFEYEINAENEVPDFQETDFSRDEWNTIDLPYIIHGYQIREKYPELPESSYNWWLVKKFRIDSRLKGDILGLWIGRIEGAVKVYVNGRLIGTQGRTHPNYWFMDSTMPGYMLHPDILSYSEENIIAIFIQNSHSNIHLKDFFIQDINAFPKKHFLRNQLPDIVNMGIMCLLLILSAFYIINYFKINRKISNLFFAIAILGYALLMTKLSLKWFPLKSLYFYRVVDSGLQISISFLVLFSQYYYNIHKNKIFTYILIFYPILFMISLWFIPTIYYLTKVNDYAIIIAAILLSYCLYLSIKAHRSGNKNAYPILWGFIILLIFGNLEILFYLFFGELPFQIFGLGILGLILGVFLSTAKRQAYLKSELEKYSVILESKNRQLVKLASVKDEFLLNITQELRNPIQGIMGIAESMIDNMDEKSSEKQILNARMIISGCRRLSNLVNNMLDLTRINNDEIKLDLKPVDISTITDITFSLSRTLIGKKSIELINNMDKDLPPVKADENRIQQIMYNLLSNAIKYTLAGKIEVSGKYENGYITVVVSDTGVGISEIKLKEIFEITSQKQNINYSDLKMPGLSLYIAKKLIELHNGEMSVDSNIGQGTRFIFTIPAHRDYCEKPYNSLSDKEKEICFDEDKNAVDTKRVLFPEEKDFSRIMIIDDDPVSLQLIYNYLSKQNYEIHQSSDTEDASYHFNNGQNFDLIILNIMLPKGSAYRFIKKVREKFNPMQLPILIITSKLHVDDIVENLETGTNDYLSKPFNKSELISRVNTLLTLKRAIMDQGRLISLQRELELAKVIQDSIIPNEIPQISGLKIKAYYFPMDQIGGDFYDFHKIDELHVGILISDVSGHGVPAGLLSSMVKVAFSIQNEDAADPEKVLSHMNEILTPLLIDDKFLTACYIYLDMAGKTLSVSSAGHYPAFIWRKNEKRIITLKPKGSIIGVLSGLEYQVEKFNILEGDRIFLLTDGIIECSNIDGEIFGRERFLKLIEKHEDLEIDEFSEIIFKHLNIWSGSSITSGDDITLIAIDVIK